MKIRKTTAQKNLIKLCEELKEHNLLNDIHRIELKRTANNFRITLWNSEGLKEFEKLREILGKHGFKQVTDETDWWPYCSEVSYEKPRACKKEINQIYSILTNLSINTIVSVKKLDRLVEIEEMEYTDYLAGDRDSYSYGDKIRANLSKTITKKLCEKLNIKEIDELNFSNSEISFKYNGYNIEWNFEQKEVHILNPDPLSLTHGYDENIIHNLLKNKDVYKKQNYAVKCHDTMFKGFHSAFEACLAVFTSRAWGDREIYYKEKCIGLPKRLFYVETEIPNIFLDVDFQEYYNKNIYQAIIYNYNNSARWKQKELDEARKSKYPFIEPIRVRVEPDWRNK